jgi:DNA-binding transcriptional regulator YiaG
MTVKKAPSSRRSSPERGSRIGRRLIAGMEELVETMEGGGMEAVRKKFTVRKVRVTKFDVPLLDRSDVFAIRDTLGVSQPVFAALVGVSPSLVKAWEQGTKAPSGVALRFLAEIRRNPKYWMQRVREAAVAV